MNRVEEEWIPPPDSPPPPHTSDEIDLIKPGRLTVKCIRGESIRRKDVQNAKTSLNPSLRLTLAPTCSHPLQKNSNQQQGTNENPSFNNEIIHFDVQNPHDYVTSNNDIRFRVELFDKPHIQREILGEVEISVVRFLASKNSFMSHHTERLPILQPGDSSSNSFVILEFSFIPVHEGILCVTLLECKDLQNVETKEAPSEIVCTVHVDEDLSKDTQPVMEKTANPIFQQNGEEVYLEVNKCNWFNEIGITVTGNVATGPKILIGRGNLPLLSIMEKFSKWNNIGEGKGAEPLDEKRLLPLKRVKDGDDLEAGVIIASFKFLQAGRLSVRNIHSSIGNHVLSQNSDLQLHFKTKGRASTLVQKSSSAKYSIHGDNSSISWKGEEIFLSLVDHHILQVELFALDAMETNHNLIGAGQLSILPVFRHGLMEVTTTLKVPNEVGRNLMEIGEVHFSLIFDGNGLSYPKLHPSATVVHKTKSKQLDRAPVKKPIAQEIVEKGKEVAASVTEVFSDEDIQSGFKFLDLDKNGYIGAAELKHVLVCMGELITDEEIDAMIDILDKNGDGQVGFDEFSMMGKSTNFGYESMGMDNSISKEIARPLDHDYDIKRSVFSHFVVNNKIHRGVINICREFLTQKRNAALSEVSMAAATSGEEVDFSNTLSAWKIDHVSMCRIMSIEPTGESRKVFDLLLDSDEKDKVDARHLILGLVNFIPTFSVHERCQMMLEMYDVNRSETLNFDNLLDILASNHLKSRDLVSRKAKTVMRFVDQAGTGRLIFDDLLDAATKFPNLLLPKHIGAEAK